MSRRSPPATSSAGVSAWKGREKCNDFSIGIELEGTDEQPFTDDQYRALVELTRQLLGAYPQMSAERISEKCRLSPLEGFNNGKPQRIGSLRW